MGSALIDIDRIELVPIYVIDVESTIVQGSIRKQVRVDCLNSRQSD
jgi:hypothetical protein